jgi:hypothetical protein
MPIKNRITSRSTAETTSSTPTKPKTTTIKLAKAITLQTGILGLLLLTTRATTR